MSGIYIPGMEMPTSCAECRFYGEYCYAKGDENKYSKLPCPLVPVPDHGRLIDADRKTFPTFHRKELNDYMKGWNACLRSVQQQPTIIPAEEEDK